MRGLRFLPSKTTCIGSICFLLSCAQPQTKLQKHHLYAAGEAGHLRFRIPEGAESVQIQPVPLASSASDSLEDALQRQRVPFRFRYQISDGVGRVLVDQQRDDRAHCLAEAGSHLGKSVRNGTACGAASLALPLDGAQTRGATLSSQINLTITPLAFSAPLQDLYFRVHYRLPSSAYRAGFLWQRLSVKEQTEISETVYGDVGELKAGEKSSLVKNLSKPLAPWGQVTRDFREASLYQLPQLGPPPSFRAYELIGREAKVILPLQSAETEVYLQLRSLDEDSSGTFKLCWQNVAESRGEACRDGQTFSLREFLQERKMSFQAGRIVLSADKSLIVKARYKIPPAGTVLEASDYTLKSAVLSYEAQRIAALQTISYTLPFTSKSDPTPLRLTVWAPLKTGEQGTDALQLRIKLFNARGHLIQQRQSAIKRQLSPFDRSEDESGAASPLLSLPSAIYLNASEEGQRIELEGDHDFLVHAATRREAVPASFLLSASGDLRPDPEQASWMPILPLLSKQRIPARALVYSYPSQSESPDTHDRWISFEAPNESVGTFALLPLAQNEPEAERGLGFYFSELGSEPRYFGLTDQARESGIQLAVFNERAKRATIELQIDKEISFTKTVEPGMSEFTLPLPVHAQKRLRIALSNPESLKVFLAHLEPELRGTFYVKRYLYQSNATSTHFSLEKKSPFQMISMTAISTAATPFKLRVQFDLRRTLSAGNFCCQHNWTSSVREFRADTQSNGAWAYLYNGERGRIFKYPALLKDDVALGSILGRIESLPSSPVFISLSGTVPAASVVTSRSLLSAMHEGAEF